MSTLAVRWEGAGPPVAPHKAILAEVAQRHGLTVAELLSASRERRITHPRQEAMWLMRQRGWSMPLIARRCGLSNHTTVLHGLRAYEARIGEGEAA